jgi:hypothetical protein
MKIFTISFTQSEKFWVDIEAETQEEAEATFEELQGSGFLWDEAVEAGLSSEITIDDIEEELS